jgi:DNA (cytosine-5)-methyltransferase 1
MQKRGKPVGISLFSGAGGLDIGLEKAGFDIRAFVEFDSFSCETLRKNHPGKAVIEADITKLQVKDALRKAGLRKEDVFIIAGGPPCQSFSTLGNREGVRDPRGLLFYDYLRFVKEIQPEVFIFENVKGLLTIDEGKVIETMLNELKNAGYHINYSVLRAVDFGVPQKRERVVILGCKSQKLRFPAQTYFENARRGQKKWVTVREAFSKITDVHKRRDDNLGMNHSSEMVARMKLVAPGKNFRSIPKELLPDCWRNGKHQGADTFGRLLLDAPSVTIRTAAYNPTKGRYIHPTEHRGLSTLEMAILQGFPLSYEFVGNLKEIGKQIGNAVPPPLAMAIGKAILKQTWSPDIRTAIELSPTKYELSNRRITEFLNDGNYVSS